MNNLFMKDLIDCYPALAPIQENIQSGYLLLRDAFEQGNKLLIAGNGGSCADAEHIVGELMKSFVASRPISADFSDALKTINPVLGAELAVHLQGALPALALTGQPALSTAYLNDVNGIMTYAQQVNGYGRQGDVFLGISTSGNAQNVIYAAITAKAKGMKVLALTGKDGGKLSQIANVSIIVPANETYKIQELHLPIYHTLCLMLENTFF